jgi:ribosomal protein S18 acetylase RimI-like enzyme
MTSTEITPSVRIATAADHAALGAVLGAAFFNDPVTLWMAPDLARRAVGLPAFHQRIAKAFEPLGGCQILDNPAGGALGGAVWEPLGTQAVADEDAEVFLADLVELAGPDAPQLLACFELMEQHHPSTPSHYLFSMGVDPAHQGRGLGSAMLAEGLRRCDAAGEPAYLEATSPNSRRLYARHGFEVVGEIQLPDGPCMWPMWREPAGQ